LENLRARERGREGGSDSRYPFGGGRRFQNWQSFAKKAKKKVKNLKFSIKKKFHWHL
jgi:hypothetical protein